MDASSRVDAGRNRLTGNLLAFLFVKIQKMNIWNGYGVVE